jgi:hypothetical protein
MSLSTQQGAQFLRLTGVTGEADDETMTKAAHGLRLGQEIVYVSGTGFTGLTAGTCYYAIPVSADTFRLATSAANARAGTAVALSADGSSGVFQTIAWQCDDEAELDVFGESLTRSYRTLWVNWRGTHPALGTAHPDNAECRLMRVRPRRLRGAHAMLCDVTLIYGELPTTKEVDNTSYEEVDVRLHPNYASVTATERREIDAALLENRAPSGLGATATELYGKLLSGVTSYIVGTTERTVTEYAWSEPSDVTSDVGTIDAPPGIISSSWLCVSGGKQQESGGYWSRTKVHRYSARGWDSDLY